MKITNIKEITDFNGNMAIECLIKNAEIKWAFLAEPSDMSGKYEVTIELDNEVEAEYISLCNKVWNTYKTAKKLKTKPQAVGFGEVKDEDGNETGIKKLVAKAIHTSRKGKVLPPPLVIDTSKQKIDLKEYPTIGNGTVANVKVAIQAYEFNKQHGVSVKLLALQIVKLVEYSGSSVNTDDFDEIEDDEEF